jgi:hypothetical protein
MLLNGWARAAGLRVAVVRSPDAAPVVREATTQLGAVLLAAGFDTVEVAPTTDTDARGAIEQAGLGARVFATLALHSVASSAAIDVWIADSMTQKTSVRRITIATRSISTTSREIALQGLDLLRASLLELEAPPSSWAGDGVPLPRIESRATPRRANVRAERGGTGLTRR